MGKRLIPDLVRGKPSRNARQRFFIFCEGENTEKVYFEAIRRKFCGTDILLDVTNGAGVPLTIAKKAAAEVKELRKLSHNSFEKDDQVWAVFDRDTHPNYDEAINLCTDNHVETGRSNPCFELWLILHKRDFNRPDDHHAVQKHLSTVYHDYDPKKGKTLDCTPLMDTVERAETRAATLLARRAEEGTPFGAPSTTVGQLTQAIRNAANAHRPNP